MRPTTTGSSGILDDIWLKADDSWSDHVDVDGEEGKELGVGEGVSGDAKKDVTELKEDFSGVFNSTTSDFSVDRDDNRMA